MASRKRAEDSNEEDFQKPKRRVTISEPERTNRSKDDEEEILKVIFSDFAPYKIMCIANSILITLTHYRKTKKSWTKKKITKEDSNSTHSI
jgi:hypothetical protein